MTVPSADLIELAVRNRLVVEATVFDVYQGKGLPEGKKSVALRLVYRSPKRTLTAEDVTKAESSILRALETRLGAELRA
jgi:phenylalanyl-tRNA synthetase beta chain